MKYYKLEGETVVEFLCSFFVLMMCEVSAKLGPDALRGPENVNCSPHTTHVLVWIVALI